jgi:uncharacterized FlaG/YvyC family protein
MLPRTYSEHDSEVVAQSIANQLKAKGKNARYRYSSVLNKFIVLIED